MEARPARREAKREVVTLPGRRGGVLALWSPWLLSAGGWGLHLVASYAVVDWYCRGRSTLSVFQVQVILHGITLLSLALSVAAVVLAARNLRLLNQEEGDEERDSAYGRSRFLTLSGLIFSVYMTIIILLEEWANFVLVPCQ